MKNVHRISRLDFKTVAIVLAVAHLCLPTMSSSEPNTVGETVLAAKSNNLRLAKIYLAASDYRRAIQACQQEINELPSPESYAFLTYVYHALDGHIEWLASKDDWGTIGQLSLSLATRGSFDLVDPPDIMPRMAKELLQEGLRQQFDMTAAMANRLNKQVVDKLWLDLADWKQSHPENWWAGVPPSWHW